MDLPFPAAFLSADERFGQYEIVNKNLSLR